MSANYALAEGSERDFKQLAGQKKNNAGMAYGDLIAYVQANDNWEPAAAGSVRPFGFCGNTDILTQSTNNMTGAVTYTKGAAAADTHCSVIVRGFIRRIAGGTIPAGEYVMPDATTPLTKVQVWNGTSGKAIVGRYVRNITQWTPTTDGNLLLPAAAADDIIIIEFAGDDLIETGTGA